jgi:hypothetical protein
MILQKLVKKTDNEYKRAEYYYSILSAINDLKLTEREIELIAYTAIKGNITYANVREEFCRNYKTTGATINNIISKLKKIKIFIKEDGKVKVNPMIVLDFKKPVVLQITLNDET